MFIGISRTMQYYCEVCKKESDNRLLLNINSGLRGSEFMTIQKKLFSVLMILFMFIVGLVVVNFCVFTSLEGDAPSINLSGNLRFRAYKLVVLSDEYL